MSIRKRGRRLPDRYLSRSRPGHRQAHPRYLHLHGYCTAAKAEERRLLRERDLGTYVSPTTLTVKEYLEQMAPRLREARGGSDHL